MPRYYFDVEVLGLMEPTPEGEEFPDLNTAIAVANECAMEMVAADIASGDGAILHRISFLEAEELARSSPGKPYRLQ